MNTDQIAYLIDIAKTGSINTTAKRMFSSQQAVSEAIKRLEHELNCTILERSKRGVTLTEDGKYVLQHVAPVMEQYQQLLHHFHDNSTAPSGILHIGVALLASNTILTDLLFRMYRAYPDITLYTKELWIDEMLEALLHKELDFGIAGFSEDSEFTLDSCKQYYGDSLQFQPLYTDDIVCIMHKNNPAAVQKTLTIEQFMQLKQTQYNLPIYQNDNTYLHISNNTALHKKFMQEENTVCLLSNQMFKALYSEKEFIAVPVTGTKPTTTCLIYRKQESKNAIYQTFIKTAVELTQQI